MRLVDTHCHLDFPDYEEDLEEVLTNAKDSGVERIIIPGTTVESSRKAVELATKYSEIFAAIGIHPHEADEITDSTIQDLRTIGVTFKKIVAVGEVGLDYYKGYSSKENQKKLLERSLTLARELDLPVIFHNREAGDDFVEIIKRFRPRGVMHCFSGSEKLLVEVLDLGLYISFAGNITFEKAEDLRNLARLVPVERLLLETDGPFLTPEPLRGKRNEPCNVKYLLDLYTEMYKLSAEDIARITSHNANQLFGLGLQEEPKTAYAIRNSMYLNITNRCTNRCTFCTRDRSNFVKGHNLKLSKEPTAEEVMHDMGDISGYDEIVFCGFGEPTMRLDVIKKIASYAKTKNKKVRLTTNGEGDLINDRIIAPELKGLIDSLSISINAADAETYDRYCRSEYGKAAYGAILNFIKNCREEDIEVEVTCLDVLNKENIEACRRIAKEYGAIFRQRYLNVVG